VKILVKVLLSSIFVFLPAIGCAQDGFNLLLGQISKVQRECQDKQFVLEMKLQDQQKDIQDLAKRQDALKQALDNAKFDIEFLKSMRDTDGVSKKLNTAVSKLYETEERLRKAEETIEMLDLRLSALEPRASKLKTPVRKSTPDFIPDSPATTPHPVSKKSDASKPKAPVNKPTPTVKEGTH